MKILLVSATEAELKPLRKKWSSYKKGDKYNIGGHQINVFVSGVGMLPTAVNLTKYLAGKFFDVVLNIGIVGGFKNYTGIGDVVEVISDQVYLEGAEDKEEFKSIYDLGLRTANELPFEEGVLKSTYCHQSFPEKKVRGISLNLVHGKQSSIEKLESLKIADVESMEGAAFFYACHQNGLKTAQIKAISNFIEPRNKDNWNIDMALNNLANKLDCIIKDLK